MVRFRVFFALTSAFNFNLLLSQPIDTTRIARLDSLIAEVLVYNAELLAMQAGTRAAQARIPQASAWESPQVSVRWMETPTSSVNFLSDAMEREIGLTQMIPISGMKGAETSAAESFARAASASSAALQQSLAMETKKNVAMLYSAQRRLLLNHESERLLKQMSQAVQTRSGVGLATQADVLRLQIEQSKLENDRAILVHTIYSAEQMLNALRGQKPHSPIGWVVDISLGLFGYDANNLERQAVENRTELAAAHWMETTNQFELTAAKRERIPDIMLGGAYKSFAAMPGSWELMLGVSIPLAPWSSGKYSGKIEEREQRLQESRATARETENRVRFEVHDAWAKARAHWESAERYRTRILPDAEQALETLRSQYQTGRADFLSLLDAFRMLQMFRMEYYTEIADYLGHRAELERAIGGPLE
jgi:outer membrane protein TolC